MEFLEKGTFHMCILPRMHVYDIWVTKNGSPVQKNLEVFRDLVEKIPDFPNKENLDFNAFKLCVRRICSEINNRLKSCHRNKPCFLKKYSTWLSVSDEICVGECKSSATTSTPTASTVCKRGRPLKDFSECGKRTRQRRLAEVSRQDESLSKCLRDVSKTSISSEIQAINPDEVVSLLVEAKLSKHQYLLIKDFMNNKLQMQVLPSYRQVLISKKECYPKEIVASEKAAEVKLQNLLDHTVSRIVKSQIDVIENVSVSPRNFVLMGKWGFDGSTGYSEYKQSFSETHVKDNGLFVTSYVPLRLVDSSNGDLVWKNPRPSSVRYCRPIRFQLKKETVDVSRAEEKYFKDQISLLTPTALNINGQDISISHDLQLTMIDGKVCSALSETSSARCYICEATPSEMNNIEKCLTKPVHTERFEFGLSTLHAWIRFFEYFIHVSYRINEKDKDLDIKKWQVRSEEDKKNLSLNKSRIQSEFRKRLGLIVDQPISGGSGTSNDGNTARRFFENSEISAEITGLDRDLIDRCSTILKAMSSGYAINIVKFKEFALETAFKLVQAYDWYYLPASVHKILLHASEVIEHAILPIGELSEEAAEAKNKDIKTFRLNNTRKFSRTVTNLDLINRLLLSSDPYITGLRKLPKKTKKTHLSVGVLELLSCTRM